MAPPIGSPDNIPAATIAAGKTRRIGNSGSVPWQAYSTTTAERRTLGLFSYPADNWTGRLTL
jgi:hypothetical protein